MTIYDIKRLSQDSSRHYFTRNNLKFAGQTMKDFKVYKQTDGRYLISAPLRDRFTRKVIGESKRYFNPQNNTLERN